MSSETRRTGARDESLADAADHLMALFGYTRAGAKQATSDVAMLLVRPNQRIVDVADLRTMLVYSAHKFPQEVNMAVDRLREAIGDD